MTNIRIFCRGIKTIFQTSKAIFLLVLMDVLLALIPFLTAQLMSQIVTGFNERIALGSLVSLLCAYVLLNVFRGLYRIWSQYAKNHISHRIQMRLKSEVLDTLNHSSPERFENEEWNLDIRRKERITACLMDEIVALGGLIGMAVMFGSFVLYLLPFSPWIALAGCLPFIPTIFTSVFHSQWVYRKRREMNPLIEREKVLKASCFQTQNSKEIRLFQSIDFLINRWREYWKAAFRADLKISNRETLIHVCVRLVTLAVYGVLLLLMVGQYYEGRADIGVIIALIPFTVQISNSFQQLQQTFHGVLYSHYEWRELQQFYAQEAQDAQQPDASERVQPDRLENRVPSLIHLENVSFHYPNGKDVLHNISLDIQKGETVAFVGENGSGKTTLLKIICGAFRPQNGVYVFDRQHTVERHKLACVFQDPIPYPFSVGQNISMRELSAEQLTEISREVGLPLEELQSRSDVLDVTFIGGTNISGGQWQRIALAHAHAHSDAEIFLFDEPTAALDPEAEIEIFNLFRRIAAGKTILLSSHRLGITRRADKIVVVNKGEIEAVGRHEQLIEQKGTYQALYRAQAAWYQNEVLKE